MSAMNDMLESEFQLKQEIESLRQQLAVAREREQTNDTLIEQQGDKLAALNDLLAHREAQIVMLRDALTAVKSHDAALAKVRKP